MTTCGATRGATSSPTVTTARACTPCRAGATVTSELVAEPALRSGALRRVAIDLPERPFFVLRHRERYRSKAAEALLLIVRSGKSRPQRGGA